MIILLDLEQTLIEEWGRHPKFLPAQIACIRSHLQAHPQAELGLMSWAVWKQRDLDEFDVHLRPRLEEALGRCFGERWTLSLEGWAWELTRATGKILPMDELFDIFGKDEVFLSLARRHPEWEGQDVVLWDDAFGDMELRVPGRGVRAEIRDISLANQVFCARDTPVGIHD